MEGCEGCVELGSRRCEGKGSVRLVRRIMYGKDEDYSDDGGLK